jgi:hypothetical protein
VHGDSENTEFLARPQHAERDLATIGDQDF